MSVPVPPVPPARPARPHAAPPAAPARRTPPPQIADLRESLRNVLSGLRFPARRWEVIAEADSWGVGGPLRQVIGQLPDGNYPSLAVVLDVLTAPAGRSAPDPGRSANPGRVVVPMRAPANGPRRPA